MDVSLPDGVKHPAEYTGELLCPRCGAGAETGSQYAHCYHGYSHGSTCAVYQYGDLCPECDRDVERSV